ncbi:hypothetical protein K458DRAFT_113835 [Lentithecium fluviatile CBS 122367]|uniref:Uncharacterized protein n=1 Tax=Lentithecium fluviatile CBS 122367 TaxID=1168545 RepID=A0A6G1IP48_9PLEO|nr:hypothetical protein K458DRAFT_113835 [Lentithecium fluviatile CBS 122367]
MPPPVCDKPPPVCDKPPSLSPLPHYRPQQTPVACPTPAIQIPRTPIYTGLSAERFCEWDRFRHTQAIDRSRFLSSRFPCPSSMRCLSRSTLPHEYSGKAHQKRPRPRPIRKRNKVHRAIAPSPNIDRSPQRLIRMRAEYALILTKRFIGSPLVGRNVPWGLRAARISTAWLAALL